jgi:hypothetical protein
MNRILCLLVTFSLFLSACGKREEPPESVGTVEFESTVTFPNYLIINAPPSDPALQWYVNDFHRRVDLWEPETTNYTEFQAGMYELSQFPNQAPTQAQEEAARKLVDDSFAIALRNGWFDKEKGLADGYEKMYGDPVHYVNVEYVFDGETLNIEKPEVLMYYKSPQGDYLMGIMFLAIGERGPQVGGPLTVWHYHIDRTMCYEQGVLPIATLDKDNVCAAGFHNIRSPEMLHLWFFDHPDGRFATTMGLTENTLKFGIEQIDALRKENP